MRFKSMTGMVNVDHLTAVEAESVGQAVDIYRASPTSPLYFHTAPMRDEAGRLCEVRFFADGGMQHPLAVIRVEHDGALAPIEDLM